MAGTGLYSRLLRLCQKELKETIRDRRTIVTLLLMPLLVYPLLSMALNRFLLTADVGGDAKAVTLTIGVGSDEEGLTLREWLDHPMGLPPEAIVQTSNGGVANFEIVSTAPEDPVDVLRANKIDLAVRLESKSVPPSIALYAFNGDSTSLNAQRIITERLHWFRMRSAEVVAQKVTRRYTAPAAIDIRTIGEPQQKSMLATIVPLVLVLMTITGAVYPAIDLTAGERERGTMESLMASPVPRFYVLFAKYIAVVTVAMLTAVANLLAMFTTLWAARLLPLLTGGSESFPWLSVLHIFALLILFSGFFSALLLSLTSFAKSFKEAQAYLIPVMLLSLTPGMLSLMPGVTLSGPLAIAPLVNIVILARDLLSGTADPAAALAAIVSTVAYAAAALAVAAKLFGSDAVTRTSEQSIGSLFRRPLSSTDVPSPQTAALMLALLVPIYFVVSNALIRTVESFRESMTLSNQLCLNAVALAATFGLVPLFAAVMSRCRYRSTYRIWIPKFGSILGAILIGCGAWSIAHEAFVFADMMGIGGLDEERIKRTLETLDAFAKASPFVLIVTLAATPAVIEELCFRGFLFSSLSKVLSPARVIVITSVIFGLFHVLTGNALLIERFIPTTLLGLILGWIAHRTGSVLPGILMHFVHNALLELVAHYHKDLEFLGVGREDQTHLPPWLLITGVAIATIGAIILWASTQRNSSSTINERLSS